MIMAAKKKSDQSGQALIELIIFLPLMFGIYGMIRGFANAINGSINQQKVTRSYYYFRIQNNSMVPRPLMEHAQSWSKFGMSFVGWADHLDGVSPIATCYQITIPMTPSATDRCQTSYSTETTSHIRVGTAYGICGATFAVDGESRHFYQVPDSLSSSFEMLLDFNSCTIQ